MRFGIVRRGVKTAALFSREGALDDELRHCSNIPQLQKVSTYRILPVILVNLLLQKGDSAGGPTQTKV